MAPSSSSLLLSSTSSSTKTAAAAAAVAVATAYLTFRACRALSAPTRPKQFSKLLNDDEKDGKTTDLGGKPRGNIYVEGFNVDEIAQRALPAYAGVATVWSVFKTTAMRCGDLPCHGTLSPKTKTWKWETYSQVFDDTVTLGRGFEALNLFCEDSEKSMRLFGLFGPNSSNWVKCEYGAISRSVTTVTLYATLTRDGIVHVLNLTGVATVACLSPECAMRCLDAKSSAPGLKAIVVEATTPELIAQAEKSHVKIVTLEEVKAAGRTKASREVDKQAEPKPSGIFTFCFTSGSTALPKGALIDHKAMVLNICASVLALNVVPGMMIFQKECYLSYLPLAHQMERMLQAMMYAYGSRIGFSRGDPALIMEDVALLRPTIFGTVPRLLARLADGMRSKAAEAGGLKSKLFFYAVKCKLADLTNYAHFTHPFWDRLVFNAVRKRMGFDRLKIIITGSAPIAPRVLDFTRVVLCVPVNEGYGQTENTCSASIAHPYHVGGPEERQSHVGAPVAGCIIKLESIPEMQYFITDRKHGNLDVVGRGEVLIRSPCVMRGYYKMDKQPIDERGWLHTGDVGTWLSDGTLSIIDRASNIFKTSVGEYVCPEKIERAVCRSPVVAQAFVFGTTLNARLVAICCLNMEALPKFCQSVGLDSKQIDPSSPSYSKFREAVTESVRMACREASLLGYEIPAALSLQTKPFTPDTGVLTATFKLARKVAKAYYKNELIELYRELGETVVI